ncbi:MAG: succinate dehydrogenase assembly factor 2 [Burkholderiaceae bacterium]|nr:succinate dehydrogenase assembly factor 2 [Burkholderiaceae bacterium]MCD8517494.1 succinate dehydrogenase assembly factor 2 [Burkholderiaceae bacterium]MCD8537880.1 succinate dehydrogenase assembly factor 2 [Burkholderiaceae bacterium]MCD8565926.1 succinate dehydrogenase assembly factor 2 [Burkholderiaceae bacterium]
MSDLTDLERTRLRWRARRGLLENDLIITRFLDANEDKLTNADVDGLAMLLDLGDNDLLDILLSRKEPDGSLDCPEVRDVLTRIRAA